MQNFLTAATISVNSLIFCIFGCTAKCVLLCCTCMCTLAFYMDSCMHFLFCGVVMLLFSKFPFIPSFILLFILFSIKCLKFSATRWEPQSLRLISRGLRTLSFVPSWWIKSHCWECCLCLVSAFEREIWVVDRNGGFLMTVWPNHIRPLSDEHDCTQPKSWLSGGHDRAERYYRTNQQRRSIYEHACVFYSDEKRARCFDMEIIGY